MISPFIITKLLSCATGGSSPPAPDPQVRPVVRKVDHVVIRCADPAALLDTLTRTLGLPVAWPLSPYSGFTTGGVYAGNANIETLRYGDSGQLRTGPAAVTAVYGIVFEPYPLADVLDEFRQRGAEPAQPVDQMRTMDGRSIRAWTNVVLNALCTENYIVYLCNYAPELQQILAKHALDNPAPLEGIGLTGLREIVVSGSQPERTRQFWQKTFAPAAMSEQGKLFFGSGPAIRISSGSRDIIEALVLEVDSLEKAQTFLRQNGLLGAASKNQLRIDPSKIQGLDIRLVQR